MNFSISEKDNLKSDECKSLEQQIKVIEDTIKIFFQNRFNEADHVFASDENLDSYIYYKCARAYMAFIFACITMEKPFIDDAFEKVNAIMSHVKKMRKGTSLTSWFFKTDYNEYTDEECHAEVIFGEANFMHFMLIFIDDPNIFALIRAIFNIRNAHNAYKMAGHIYNEKNNWKSEVLQKNFNDAYQLGWGFYNITMSFLPDRLLRILNIVGYDCDRQLGFTLCKNVTENQLTYRSKVLEFLICFYSLYMEQFFGSGTADLEWVKEITKKALVQYPDSVFDLFYGARVKQITGNTEEAIGMFEKCIKCQNEFPALHNVATWDLLWSYAIKCDWKKASECALFLEKNCNWSKATNLYQWICFQHIIMEEENRPELLPAIEEAMKRVPELRRRYIGKTIPPEKFAITKANSYLSGKTVLHLPVFELFYIWNVFGNTQGKPELLDPILQRIERKIEVLRGSGDEGFYTLLLLKGVCLRNYGRHEDAVSCFQQILNDEKSIREMTYVPPHAALELGLSYLTIGKVDESKKWLLRARDHYTGFLVESLAHLRIHGALCQIKYHMKENSNKPTAD